MSGMAVPAWASVAGLLIAAGFAVMLLREARKQMKNDSDLDNAIMQLAKPDAMPCDVRHWPRISGGFKPAVNQAKCRNVA